LPMIRLDPKNAEYHFRCGCAWYRCKAPMHACLRLDEAIRLDPRFSFVYHDRGIAYRMKGDRDHAISDFREAVRLNPDIAGPSRAALESLGVGEPKKEPDAPKRGVLDLLK